MIGASPMESENLLNKPFWVIQEENKLNIFRKIISHLKGPELKDLCLCLLMVREYDGLRGRGKDEGIFLKYDIQIEETLKMELAAQK